MIDKVCFFVLGLVVAAVVNFGATTLRKESMAQNTTPPPVGLYCYNRTDHQWHPCDTTNPLFTRNSP